jgi:hypothetical protein
MSRLITGSPNRSHFIIGIYLVAAITVGYLLRRDAGTSAISACREHFLRGYGDCFLAVNCGALEFWGSSAATQIWDTRAALHWIGAIPAMFWPCSLCRSNAPVSERCQFLTVRLTRQPGSERHLSRRVMAFQASVFTQSLRCSTRFGWSFFHIVLVTSAIILW